MGLHIQRSNRVEALQRSFSRKLAQKPLSNPLARERVIVPTYAMSRWLNLRFAEQHGIAANFEYLSPSAWLWQTAAQVLDEIPQRDPLAIETSAWRIFSLLPELLDRQEFSGLRQYLEGDSDGIKRWQLSSRIAEVFDRYQQYRPELIRDWCTGRSAQWQAVIWRRLIAPKDAMHRVAVLDRLIERLRSDEPPTALPERVALFAIASLAPMTLEVILAFSRCSEVTFYQHSPSEHYFADLKSSASLQRMRLQDSRDSQYYETGNELLASWGRQAQIMQALLLEHDCVPTEEVEENFPAGDETLLTSIQQSIFDLGATPLTARSDGSISVHVCHSPMRECQVLHDRLLKILSDNPHLSPQDILVMSPEISRYAPYIQAVFGYDEGAGTPQLPWNLSDISLLDEHPLIQSFLQLLRLPGSRFEISEVMSLLEVGEIRAKFDLDETALADIQHWIEVSRVRWGIDAEFKQDLGQAGIVENTWLQARNRLFAGYALGEVALWKDIAPLAQFDTTAAVHISRFLDLFERLEYWRTQLRQSTAAADWIRLLNRLLEDFYGPSSPGDSHLEEIREAIDGLNSAANSKLSAPLLRHWMQKRLARQLRQGRLFSGGVTFCGLRPMRNLPFEVICLIGMNDQAFPRKQPVCDFDNIRQSFRPGDPDSRAEDRYLMLETLLCARHSLYISYTGRSVSDNSVLQPSVLVSELLDYIDSQNDTDSCLSEKLVQVHPMQPFAPGNYLAPLFSYDALWCEVARKIRQGTTGAKSCGWPLATENFLAEEPRHIDLNQLQRFLAHPVRYYFNTRLNLYFENEDELEDDELFTLDSLAGWQNRSRLLDYRLEGQSDVLARLRAEGLLPHGPAGKLELNGILRENEDWLERIAAFSDIATMSRPIQLQLADDISLYGAIENYYPGRGIALFSPSKLNGPRLLRLWVDHLCLCASQAFQAGEQSTLFASDQTVYFSECDTRQALELLADYCRLFIQGQSHLLPVFPKSSYAFAEKDDPQKALNAALKAWYSSPHNPVRGDEDDPYLRLALRGAGAEPVQHPQFAIHAARIYQSVLAQRLKA